MKKIHFILILLLTVVFANAQITITGDDLPLPGKAFSLGYDSNPGGAIQITAAGATAQTWDFSTLNYNYPKFAVYSPTAPYHQYATAFSDANLYTYGPSFMFSGLYGGAPVNQTGWGYMYWRSDSTGHWIVGFRGDYGAGDKNVLEQPQEMLMGAPASLDSVFTNSARWVVEQNEVPGNYDTLYISTVQKTLTVDAFGSITVPGQFGNQTYDVIRVHEYFIGIDSLSATFLGNPVYSIIVGNDTLNNYYFWAKDVGFPVATIHADKNNNIIDVEYLYHDTPSYTISGKVYEEDGSTPVTDGNVQLYAKDAWDHLFGVEENVSIVGDGNFQFSNVTWGNWLVLAEAASPAYSGYIPTYYGNEVAWENAGIVPGIADTAVSIVLVTDASSVVQTGTGQITGTIWQDTLLTKAFSNATQAGNVKVTLEENPGGAALLSTKSANDGSFSFNNLADGDYTMKVEIAGIKMDSTYFITVTNGAQVHENNDYMFDSVYAYILESNLVEEIYHTEETHVSVYPNPFRTDAQVEVLDADGEFYYDFRLYDLNGRMVDCFKGYSDHSFTITNNNLKEGMYIFELSIDNTKVYSGKILTERK